MSRNANLRIKNLDKWGRALDKSPEIVRDEVRDGAERGIDFLRREAAKYPPERPGQRYKRTYRLQKGWFSSTTRERDSGGRFATGDTMTMLTLSNPTPYGKWVQARSTQAWMHKGRWQTAEDVVEDNEARVRGELETAMQRAAARITTEAS